RGTTIAGNGVPGVGDSTDQDFALVVSNANEAPSPVLAGDATSLTDPGPGADGDGALDPGESFTLDQSVRNDGESDATAVSGTMSASGVMFTSSSSSYGDVSPDEVEANTTPFAGQLDDAATCGGDVNATLSLTTAQGPEAIPIVLPTGAAGAPDPQSAAHAPGLTIPDDSSLGVTSTITVSSPGRIKDLDVRIGRITHGWVGDLVIDLKGPDGTTVTLARHPGGPDYGGDNFVNTVFDDEAPTSIASGTAPYTGSFRPQGDQLSRFDGKNKQGPWRLRVRDLFESETGQLESWGTTTRSAVCDPPQTSLVAGPSEGQAVASTSATFEFTASIDPSLFECSLDGQDFQPCPSPKSYENLGQGLHTFAVRALDADGDADQSPAVRTWSVDTVGPAVHIDAPSHGSTLSDQTPTLSGSIGTAAGDLPGVAVRIHSGASPSGAVVQSLAPTLSGDGWSATAAALPEGTYTARAEQADSLGNVGAATSTFTIDLPDPPPPSFLLAPAEERLADALAGRTVVTVACASACEARAKLKVSARAARSLGLGAKPTALGSGVKRLARAGTAAVRVRLTGRARAALRGKRTTRATLRVTLKRGGESLVLSRTVSLLRSAGPARLAARGLKLWTVCSERCPLSGKLTLSAKTARRIGLRPKGSARMNIASGRARAPAGKPTRLTLKVRKGAKKALRRASKVGALLEAAAGPKSGPRRTAKRSLTLRR
ncbi:MAG: proprotein convertase P-domain-containing protein, partial [Thermoleophilaceae bacterium]